jgi:hypothetical protein
MIISQIGGIKKNTREFRNIMVEITLPHLARPDRDPGIGGCTIAAP